MKKTIQLFAGMISISSSMLLTACGQPQVSIARPMEVKASQTNPDNGSPTSSAATTTHALKQVLRYSIEGVGSGGQQIKVYTKNTLKMRFIPGVQTQTDSQTGRVSHYTALSVSLRVGSRKITLPFLRNALLQGQADPSAIIDLSSAITPLCSEHESGVNCFQNVTVVVENPINDDACNNLSWSACPVAPVPNGHAWNGQLLVQTDLTEAL